jgi:hypothetical protein
MAHNPASGKVSVNVFQKDRKYFANIQWYQAQQSLGPADSRDDIYQLVYGFLADLKLATEIHQVAKPQK